MSASPQLIQSLRDKATALRRTVEEERTTLDREQERLNHNRTVLAQTERELEKIEAMLRRGS